MRKPENILMKKLTSLAIAKIKKSLVFAISIVPNKRAYKPLPTLLNVKNSTLKAKSMFDSY